MGFKVFNECCKNCLLTPDRIVSSTSMKQHLNECARQDTYFICHKASMKGEKTCCSAFYKTLGDRVNLIRIMQRLNAVEFVDQPDQTKLPSWEEMKGKKR